MLRKMKKLMSNAYTYLREGGAVYIDKVQPMCFEDKEVFKSRTILITGGGSGMGKALAIGMAEHGAKVIITGRTEAKLKDVAKLNSNIQYMVWDVSDVGLAETKMRDAFCLFGQVDTLVNSAGIYRHNNIRSLDEKTYDELMDINMKGTYFLTKAFIDNVHGRTDAVRKIINICSVRSFTSDTTSYALSKHALRCFTEGLAKELKDNNYIVNGIAPGPTVSEINNNNDNKGEDGNLYLPGKKRMHRFLSVDEVVNVAKFLISDFSNGINGQVIIVDGGEISVD